jgi:putative MATE family efflux protein
LNVAHKLFSRIFSTQFMVNDKLKRGEITPNREAYRTVLWMALPAVAEMVSVAVIGMADTAMVGVLGDYAVAAVGLTAQPRMIFLSLIFALNVGVTAIVSRRKGEGDQDSARLCLRQALVVELALVLILTVASLLLSKWLMGVAGAEADTIAPATEYFRILSCGLLFNAVSMTICGAQRGIGNTRITMTVNLTANLVNVVFNFLLIGGNFGFPRLGVAGAAIATVMGYAVGMALAIRSVVIKDSYLRISKKDDWKLNKPMLKSITKIGGNSVLEQIVMRVGFFSYAAIVARLGTASYAAHLIAMQLMNLSFTFADGIAAASTSLVGQNLGKKRPDLSIMYGKIGQRFALVISIVLCIVSITGRAVFPTLFTKELATIAAAAEVIFILGLIQPIQTTQIVMAGSLRGAGDTRFVAITMLFTAALLRPSVSLLFIYVLGWGLPGAWYAVIVDQCIRLFLLYRRFSQGKWISIKV